MTIYNLNNEYAEKKPVIETGWSSKRYKISVDELIKMVNSDKVVFRVDLEKSSEEASFFTNSMSSLRSVIRIFYRKTHDLK